MINGLLLGIIAAFFWSLTNIIDKYLTARHAEDGDVWGILILSCFFPAILLPICISLSTVSAPLPEITLLVFTGGLMVGWIFFYLKALTEDDTSVVMTLLVLAPFFSLIFSHFILGETLSSIQMIGGGLLILGSLIVSYTPVQHSFNFKLIFYAVSASTIMGLMHTLFKFSTIQDEFWRSMFWRSGGMVLVGILLCLCVPHIWRKFFHFTKHYLGSGLTLNTTNESLTLLGDTLFGFAVLLAPIALIQTTEAYQPLFIICITFILSRFGFDSISEDYTRLTIFRKVFGISIIIIGSIILSTYTNSPISL